MERVWSTSYRGFSVRSILTFVLTVFITALLWVTFGNPTPTHAATTDPATWKGASILYDGHQYFDAGEAKAGDSTGLAVGTHYYLYTPDTTGSAPKTVKAMVIYFAPGTDPPTEKTATYITYDYSPAKVFSHPAGKTAITVTPQGNENSYSSCTVQGIGWIICPITVFLANSMDWIFDQVKSFFVVTPVSTNTTSSLYIAWNVMRSVANVAFIIAFLIIIYSQVTSAGISNYGLKKLMPRLIIAAILVNLSYLISAVAVDISNILGFSIQDIFVQIRQNTFNISDTTWANSGQMGWSAIAAFVLSGGAATIGVAIATGGTIAGAVYLLIPLLLGLVLTILVVLLILAARQAIIIILIVIAPLAFVAYLLPNTEQWFKKWRELFMTMLVFFPAFSLVFGGSQLAGGIIIQNATSIIGVIFGLAVQVAPLIITPLLLRLSGGLLGKIAGVVNNPNKGLLDRTKKWSGARAEMHRQRGIGGDLKKRNVFRRTARRFAYSNDRVERNTARYKAGFEENATRRAVTTKAGQKIEAASTLNKSRTEDLNHSFGQAMEEMRTGDSSALLRLRNQEGAYTASESFRTSWVGGKLTGERLTREDIVEIRSERKNDGKRFAKYALKIAEQAVEVDQSARAIETATAIAKNIQLTNYANKVEHNIDNLQVRAGGIAGERGQQGALAAAFKAQSAAHGDAVANANSVLSHYNYGDDTIVEIAKGNIPANVHFNKISDALKEAAITKIASGANASALLDLMENIQIDTSDANQDFRQAFADALLTNSAKPKFAGAGIIADIKQGKTPTQGRGRIDSYVVDTINANKFSSADTLVGQDRDYLEALERTLTNNQSGKTIDNAAKVTLLDAIDTMRANPIYSGRIGERKKALDGIENLLRNQTGIPRPTSTPTPEE